MHVDDYKFGEVKVNGERYIEDLIIYPDHIEEKWWRDEGHSLHPKDIEDILKNDIDVLIIGTGAYGRMRVLPETEKMLESRGIKMVSQKTGRATRVFNKMLEEGKTAVAALHLDC